MRHRILFLLTALSSYFFFHSKAQYLQIHMGGKIAHTFNLEDIDYLEIVDNSDIIDMENPKVKKRMSSINGYSFVYQNDRISQVLYNGNVSTNIEYSESAITIKGGNNTSGIYYLNKGLVTKYVKPSGSYEVFTYEDGRLKNWKKYYENDLLAEDITFEWKDGVIIRQTELHPYWEGGIRYENRMELFCQYEYSYTTDPDYGGVVAIFQDNSLFYDDLPEELIIQGYFGKWPKYLVSKAVDVSGYFSRENSYKYALDSDGYPLKISGSESAKFTWENVK